MYLAWGHTFWLILLSYVGVGPVSDSSDSEVTQSRPTLCDPMDCSLSGSSVHGIFQARILEWVAVSFSRGSSQPKDRTRVSCIVGRRFTVSATREVLKTEVTQLCLTLCNPMDCSLLGTSIHGDSSGKNNGVGCRGRDRKSTRLNSSHL